MDNIIENIVLGIGTAIPINNHISASILLKTKDFNTLLDIVANALSKSSVFDVGIFSIKNNFVTHLHLEPILDLATLFLLVFLNPCFDF